MSRLIVDTHIVPFQHLGIDRLLVSIRVIASFLPRFAVACLHVPPGSARRRLPCHLRPRVLRDAVPGLVQVQRHVREVVLLQYRSQAAGQGRRQRLTVRLKVSLDRVDGGLSPGDLRLKPGPGADRDRRDERGAGKLPLAALGPGRSWREYPDTYRPSSAEDFQGSDHDHAQHELGVNSHY